MGFLVGQPEQSGLDLILSQMGQGVGHGIQQRLEQFHINQSQSQSANKIADSLNLSGKERAPIVDFLSQLPVDKQASALKALSESQMTQSALNFFGGEEIKETVDEIPGDGEKITIEGMEWGKNELPNKTREIPPFGPLADAAKLQYKKLKDNRDKNFKFSEGYEDLTKLNHLKENMLEAQRIIEEENLGGKARQFIRAIIEEKNPNLSELAKTPAEHKLYSLLYDSIRPKEFGGSNPSTKEVLLSLARAPSGLKSKEANKYIIKNMLKHIDTQILKGRSINSLLSYDAAMDPGKFRSLIDKKTGETRNKVLMKKGDQIIEIPYHLKKKALEDGFEEA